MTFLLRHELLSLDALCESKFTDSSPSAVLACVSEEQHEIPLTLANLILKELGWRTTMLGIHTPPEAAADAVIETHAKLLVLSKTFSSTSESVYLNTVVKALARCKCKILLGGPGWKKNSANIDKQIYHVSSLSEFQKHAKL